VITRLADAANRKEYVMQIGDIRVFIPAKDFSLSKHFYQTIGMTAEWEVEGLCKMVNGKQAFLLQDFYVKELAENLMLQLIVADAHSVWSFLKPLDLPKNFPGVRISPPKKEPWGTVIYLHGPSGELWHITEEAK